MTREVRSVRGQYQSDGNKLVGYAAIFNSPTQINERGRSFTEVVKPGAFARALREGQDVKALFNHDCNRLLGRTSSGTLKLAEDDHGLRFEVEMPDSAADLKELVRRGDLFGASFAFRVVTENWSNANARELTDLDLEDVSVVVDPAYRQTQVSMRGVAHWKLKNDLLRKSLPTE